MSGRKTRPLLLQPQGAPLQVSQENIAKVSLWMSAFSYTSSLLAEGSKRPRGRPKKRRSTGKFSMETQTFLVNQEWQTHRHTDRQTHRLTDRHYFRLCSIEPQRFLCESGMADRHTDRQTDRHFFGLRNPSSHKDFCVNQIPYSLKIRPTL